MANRIAALLVDKAPVPGHKPWPRYVIDPEAWPSIGLTLSEGGADLLGLWGDPEHVHLALRIAELPEPVVLSTEARSGTFLSIGRDHPPAIRLERALHDLFGHAPLAIPDRRPWLDHGQWGMRAPLNGAPAVGRRDPAGYDFLPAKGEGLHQVPVGPVHAGIIEPGHFRFTANGETVVRLEERLGYVHKGVESLMTGLPIEQAARVAARISGDSTVAYSYAFARAIEAALGVDPPVRAKVLRGMMAELERIANHIGDIGAICNDASFALIHAQCGIMRERVLQASDRAFGHRLMMDRIVPGGVEDTGPGAARGIAMMLDEIEKPFAEVVRVYDGSPSLQDRTCTTGIVSHDLVRQWAAGGYVGRASGRDFDTRRDLPYAPYIGAGFDIPVLKSGDVDVVVLSLPYADSGIVTQALYDEPFRVVLPADHDWHAKKTIPADQLCYETLLLLGAGNCFRDQVMQTCSRAGKAKSSHIQQALEGSSLETIRQMVEIGRAHV